MSRRQQVVALVLIVGMVLVFLLPSLDLLPTAMRASRAAGLIFLALAMAAVSLVAFCEWRSACFVWLQGQRRSTVGLIDLTCARLC